MNNFELGLHSNNTMFMEIHHLAIWTSNLELMKDFYTKYFGCAVGQKYQNKEKGFSSYFLSFENGGKIELMHRIDIKNNFEPNSLGFTHIAISVGNKEKVDSLTQLIENDGYKILSYPRTTGDGYYESVIADPENNSIELTV